MMEMKHDYIAEIQTRKEHDSDVVEARKSILAENDTDAQRQAEEWAGTAAAVHTGARHLVIRHDHRVVADQELRTSKSRWQYLLSSLPSRARPWPLTQHSVVAFHHVYTARGAREGRRRLPVMQKQGGRARQSTLFHTA